jgi:ABC-2 type transport system permease protein
MNALVIALKDLQILLKDRGALIYTFLFPLVFVFIFLGVFSVGGGDDGEEVTLKELPVVNLDSSGEISKPFIDGINRAGGVEVVLYAQDEAEELLSNTDIWYMLIIPPGFSSQVAAGEQATLRLVSHPDINSLASESNTRDTVEQIMLGVAQDASLQIHIVRALEQMGDMQAGSPAEPEVFTSERYIAQASSQFERAATRPLVAVEQTGPTTVAEEEEEAGGTNIGTLAVLFVFLAAQSIAVSIFEERRSGSFRRLLAGPVSKAELLGGKMLAGLVTIVLQIAVFFAGGALIAGLLGLGGMSLGNDPLAFVLLSLMVAICSTSLAIFIAGLARTERQASSVSQGILWVAAILGGSLVSIYFLPSFLQAIAQLTPHFWANQAYIDLINRGQTLSGIVDELIALAVFSVVFFGVGLWRFDFE